MMTKKEFFNEHKNEILNRCGVSHLLSYGTKIFTDNSWKDIEDSVRVRHAKEEKELEEKNAKLKEEGSNKFYISSNLFSLESELELQKIAYDLANMEHNEMLQVIKKVL